MLQKSIQRCDNIVVQLYVESFKIHLKHCSDCVQVFISIHVVSINRNPSPRPVKTSWLWLPLAGIFWSAQIVPWHGIRTYGWAVVISQPKEGLSI